MSGSHLHEICSNLLFFLIPEHLRSSWRWDEMRRIMFRCWFSLMSDYFNAKHLFYFNLVASFKRLKWNLKLLLLWILQEINIGLDTERERTSEAWNILEITRWCEPPSLSSAKHSVVGMRIQMWCSLNHNSVTVDRVKYCEMWCQFLMLWYPHHPPTSCSPFLPALLLSYDKQTSSISILCHFSLTFVFIFFSFPTVLWGLLSFRMYQMFNWSDTSCESLSWIRVQNVWITHDEEHNFIMIMIDRRERERERIHDIKCL